MISRCNLETTPSPVGWLVSPEGRLALFFVIDPKSAISMPRVITQLWYAKNGIPARVKNIRRVDLESAQETWSELLSKGWVLDQNQLYEAS